MAQYVLKLVHTSDQCPTSNSKVRERVLRGTQEIPKLAQKHGMKFLAGPLVLGAEHETLVIVEADRIENTYDFLLESGLMQWNSVKVSQAKSLEEALKELEKSPPPLY